VVARARGGSGGATKGEEQGAGRRSGDAGAAGPAATALGARRRSASSTALGELGGAAAVMVICAAMKTE
jgi:hypothetical protein